MSRSVALLLLTVLVLSSFVMVGCAFAQLVPKPSVPEFTLRFEPLTYYVPPIYEINPYTGENVTIQEGSHVENKSIVVTIKNQPFSYSSNGLTYHIYCNIRIKPHFAENWTQLYPLTTQPNSPYDWESESWSYSVYLFPKYQLQSNSNYTVLSYALDDLLQLLWRYPFLDTNSDVQLDFQVEAIVGHDSQLWYIEHPLAPEYGGHYESAIEFDVTSGWSETQTVIIEESQKPTSSPETTSTISPVPTSSPYDEPELSEHEVILGVAITVAVTVVGLGLLLYLIKRK
ncbi:MAG: hypothetical protein NWE84_09140 [Candidatus Bathyarchaeota archaeon]|nr:hypothetical protein [Candidatus Bathyarchaeota archaeon]